MARRTSAPGSQSLVRRLAPDVRIFALPKGTFQLQSTLSNLAVAREGKAHEAVVLLSARLLEALIFASVHDLGFEPDRNTFGNLSLLRELNLVSTWIHQVADTLRRVGNAARHLDRGIGSRDADLSVACLEPFIEWYFRDFRFGPRRPATTRNGTSLDLGVPRLLRSSMNAIQRAVASPDDLLSLERSLPPAFWSMGPDLPMMLAESLIETGSLRNVSGRKRMAAAARILRRARTNWPDDRRVRQMSALWCSRTGRPSEAIEWLRGLPEDEETVGIRAGAFKQLWWDDGARIDDLRAAHRLYADGWGRVRPRSPYLGINAAATALWLGRADDSRNLANEVRSLLLQRSRILEGLPTASDLAFDFWDQMTLAEAEALSGCLDAARQRYLETFARHPEREGSSGKTLAQLERLLPHLGFQVTAEEFLGRTAVAPARRQPRPPKEGTVYRPKPLDTSKATIPAGILELVEKLARHNHDIWAAQRIKDGWVYGPKRDDDTRQNPCLVPFKDLPDSEKVYDRNAAMETIKAILSLGYRIVAEEHTPDPANSEDFGITRNGNRRKGPPCQTPSGKGNCGPGEATGHRPGPES